MKDNSLNFIKKEYIFILLLAFVAGLFLLVFSYYTSPLYPDLYGYDAAYFMSMGRAIVHGAIPYVDFFDQKGPFLFFIQAFAMFIIDGRTGAFVTEYIFFLSTCILMYVIARQFVSKIGSFIIVLIVLFSLSITFEGGNLTEEYSLPFVLLPVLLCIKNINSVKQNPKITFIYGICFTLIAMIRITNAAIICGIVLYFLIYLLIKKEYINLLHNAIAFILGLAVAFLPFMIYFIYNNAFYDMLYGTFIFPIGYAKNGVAIRTSETWLIIIKLLSPALLCGVISIVYSLVNKKLALLSFIISIITVIAFIPGNGYRHYYSMVSPILLIMCIIFYSLFFNNRELKNKKTVFIISFTLCSIVAYTFTSLFKENMNFLKETYVTRYIYQEYFDNIRKQADIIPESERNSVWGYEVSMRWFTATGITPCYKYSAFQYTFASLDKNIAYEIDNMLDTTPPKWIIIDTTMIDTYKKLQEILYKDYELKSEVNTIQLYRSTIN